LAWLVKHKGIAPHIPVFDKSNRTDGTFSRADFVFDPERDRYTCPAGKELVQFRRTYAAPRSGVTAEGTRLYRASKLDCDVCRLKAQCCPNAVARKIPRDLNEDARDVARAHAATPQYVEACRRRKKVEMLFAHLKRILRLARLRLRGANGNQSGWLVDLGVTHVPPAQERPHEETRLFGLVGVFRADRASPASPASLGHAIPARRASKVTRTSGDVVARL
jgi:hypothetical protein